jgi:hypothetical protein
MATFSEKGSQSVKSNPVRTLNKLEYLAASKVEWLSGDASFFSPL